MFPSCSSSNSNNSCIVNSNSKADGQLIKCLLCYSTLKNNLDVEYPFSKNIFELYCRLLNVHLNERMNWDFGNETEVFPFCETCFTSVEKVWELNLQLECIQRSIKSILESNKSKILTTQEIYCERRDETTGKRIPRHTIATIGRVEFFRQQAVRDFDPSVQLSRPSNKIQINSSKRNGSAVTPLSRSNIARPKSRRKNAILPDRDDYESTDVADKSSISGLFLEICVKSEPEDEFVDEIEEVDMQHVADKSAEQHESDSYDDSDYVDCAPNDSDYSPETDTRGKKKSKKVKTPTPHKAAGTMKKTFNQNEESIVSSKRTSRPLKKVVEEENKKQYIKHTQSVKTVYRDGRAYHGGIEMKLVDVGSLTPHYECGECNQSLKSKTNMMNHIKTLHLDIRTKSQVKLSNRKHMPITITADGKKFYGGIEMIPLELDKYKCGKCDVEFKSRKYLTNHIKNMHLGSDRKKINSPIINSKQRKSSLRRDDKVDSDLRSENDSTATAQEILNEGTTPSNGLANPPENQDATIAIDAEDRDEEDLGQPASPESDHSDDPDYGDDAYASDESDIRSESSASEKKVEINDLTESNVEIIEKQHQRKRKKKSRRPNKDVTEATDDEENHKLKTIYVDGHAFLGGIEMKLVDVGSLDPHYRCGVCNQSLKSKTNILNHIRTLHLNIRTKSQQRLSNKRHTPITTTFDGKFLYGGVEMKSVGSGKYRCGKCDSVLGSKKYLMDHIKFKHLGFKRKSTYVRKPNADPRTRSVHSSDGKQYFGSVEMKVVDGLHECGQCGRTLKNKASLMAHIKNRHWDTGEGFACKHCGQTFGFKYRLRDHERCHHQDIRHFICDQCGMAFKSRDTLAGHIDRIHKKIQKHQCNFCQKKFFSRKDCTVHTRTHTGEKPYKCSQCDKCFSALGTLRWHEKYHTGEQYERRRKSRKVLNIKSGIRKRKIQNFMKISSESSESEEFQYQRSKIEFLDARGINNAHSVISNTIRNHLEENVIPAHRQSVPENNTNNTETINPNHTAMNSATFHILPQALALSGLQEIYPYSHTSTNAIDPPYYVPGNLFHL